MRKSVLAVVGIAVAIVIVGFIISRRSGTGSSPVESFPDTNVGPQTSYTSNKESSTSRPRTFSPTNPAPIIPFTKPPTPPPTNANFMTNWEEKLDNILVSDKPDPDKAKEMIEMFPQLSPEAQEEIAHHISNLTPDENYASIGKFLTNSTLPEAVLDVFTEDVLNRPNSIKLPLLLDLARDPQHPKAGESKDILELFLEEDFGADWPKWQAKLDQWLKDNPD